MNDASRDYVQDVEKDKSPLTVISPGFLTEPETWHLATLLRIVIVSPPLLPLGANHQLTLLSTY